MTAPPASVLDLTAPEFLDALASPYRAEELSAAHGVAAVVVDLTAVPPCDSLPVAVEERVAAMPCVVIGLLDPRSPEAAVRLAAWCDVAVDSPDRLDPIRSTAAAHPQASAALAILLRASENRTVADGLAAESAVYSLLQAGPEFAAWRAARMPNAAPSRTPGHLPYAWRAEPAQPSEPLRGADPAPVLVRREGGVLHLTLNRPAVHNAFSAAMRDGVAEALALAAADESITGVRLEGTGPSFCAGGDLTEFGSRPDPATAHLVRLTRSPARLLAGLADRVEVRLHGACIGAGIELPAFAGRVVAHPDTFFALPEVTLGLIPGAGGTVSLPRRIGRLRTAELALSGRRLDAPTALAWGLVDSIEG